MKILMVNKFFYRSRGAESYMIALTDLLSAEGYEVIPFCMNHERNNSTPYSGYFIENIDYYNANFLQQMKNSLNIIYSFEAKKKIARLISIERPELVHLHNIYHQISPSIFGTLKKFALPVVMTVHDYKLLCPNYQFLSHSSVCERCKINRYYHSIKQRCVKGSLAGSTLSCIEMYIHCLLGFYKKNIDIFIAPSRFVMNKLLEYQFCKEKVRYIPHFIDHSLYTPEYEPGGYILYFGRLEREKGVFELVEAMKKNRDLKLLFAGEGINKEDLKKETELAELTNVSFIGYKKWDDLVRIIQGAMFVVMPSIWYEIFGLTIIESFALGKPVIGTNIGAIPELIEDGANGFLCEPGDIDGLAEKIALMKNMKKKLRSMGKAAREKVEKFYNKRCHIERIVSIYQKLLH